MARAKKKVEEPEVKAVEAAEMEERKVDDEVIALREENTALKGALEKMMARIDALETAQKNQQPTTQILNYGANTETVLFLWEAPVADENVVEFGQQGMFGRIVGKTGSFTVPKGELSRLLTAETRFFLDKRWLIVVSGLDQQEREAMGVDYKEGELLDKQMFLRVVESGDRILEIFPNLCKDHKEIVAKFYYETWMNHPQLIERDVVLALYKMDKSPAFKKILEGMNAADLQE